jgi:hypothetical protein
MDHYKWNILSVIYIASSPIDLLSNEHENEVCQRFAVPSQPNLSHH